MKLGYLRCEDCKAMLPFEKLDHRCLCKKSQNKNQLLHGDMD